MKEDATETNRPDEGEQAAMMTLEEVRELLRSQCVPTQRSWAEAHKVSHIFVSNVLRGRQEPGPKILGELGLRRVVLYEKAA